MAAPAFTVSYSSKRCLPDAVASRKQQEAIAPRKKPTSPTTPSATGRPVGEPERQLTVEISSTRHRRLALYLLLHEARRYQREVGLNEGRRTEYMLRRCRPTPPPALLGHSPAFRQLVRDVLELQQPRCTAFPDGNYGQCKLEIAQRNVWANPAC